MLVGLDPDAVAGAVHEELAVPGVVDDLPGRSVDLGARRAHRGCSHARCMGGMQYLVQLGEPAGRRSNVDAAGDVGAVAHPVGPGHRPTDVEQDRFTNADDPVTRLVVRAGRVGARRHDGEIHPLVALVNDLAGDLGGHVGFGPPHEGHLAGLDVGQDPVDGSRCVAQGIDLSGVLDHPYGRRYLRRPTQLEVGTGGQQVHGEAGPHLVAHRGRADADQTVGH